LHRSPPLWVIEHKTKKGRGLCKEPSRLFALLGQESILYLDVRAAAHYSQISATFFLHAILF
jgi:hypothetical protein